MITPRINVADLPRRVNATVVANQLSTILFDIDGWGSHLTRIDKDDLPASARNLPDGACASAVLRVRDDVAYLTEWEWAVTAERTTGERAEQILDSLNGLVWDDSYILAAPEYVAVVERDAEHGSITAFTTTWGALVSRTGPAWSWVITAPEAVAAVQQSAGDERVAEILDDVNRFAREVTRISGDHTQEEAYITGLPEFLEITARQPQSDAPMAFTLVGGRMLEWSKAPWSPSRLPWAVAR